MSRVKVLTLVFAAIGLIVPLAILLARALSSTGFSPAWIFYVWPSYFILGGIAGEFDVVTITYVVVSVLINILLYAYIGNIVARLFRTNPGPAPERNRE